MVKILSIINRRKHAIADNRFAGQKILINISSGIGDAVMAIPLLKALHDHFPDAAVSVIANRPTQPLFKTLSFVRQIYCEDENRSFIKYLRFVKIIRKEKFTLYIGAIPSNTIRMMLLPFLSGIPLRIKHVSPHRGVRNFDFLFDHLEPIPENRHRLDCNLDLMKTIHVNSDFPVEFPLLPLPEESLLSVKKLLSESGYHSHLPLVAVHPGCNPKAHYKRWPPENYMSLLNQLQSRHALQILLVGSSDETVALQQIENGLTVKPFNVAGKMNLLETACALSFCKLLISNDSGIMHLATAVNVPVFAIFGPTNDRHIGPYGKGHHVIRNGTDIRSVTVEQVFDRIISSGIFEC